MLIYVLKIKLTRTEFKTGMGIIFQKSEKEGVLKNEYKKYFDEIIEMNLALQNSLIHRPRLL